jgi:hypothetical protein
MNVAATSSNTIELRPRFDVAGLRVEDQTEIILSLREPAAVH